MLVEDFVIKGVPLKNISSHLLCPNNKYTVRLGPHSELLLLLTFSKEVIILHNEINFAKRVKHHSNHKFLVVQFTPRTVRLLFLRGTLGFVILAYLFAVFWLFYLEIQYCSIPQARRMHFSQCFGRRLSIKTYPSQFSY